ncbi:MAG: GNAT family N-acetyltransferase [Lachnospiraceae bacterium]|nr:GNAT family N-acetyltransferase [Lachnospiraceae bacterium]
MTKKEMLEIAMEQSAEDIGCSPEDFILDNDVVVAYDPGEDAKSYYEQPIGGVFVSYGSNLVAAATEEIFDITVDYIKRFKFCFCFETPNMYWLNKRLEPLGQTVCFMSEYYLPVPDLLRPLSCPYELRILRQPDFAELYLPEWSNAICEKRKHLDVLGVGAYDGDRLVGLAGCSADAKKMWQIGVDVLPEYRKKGIASAITSRLALEIMERDKVPFYCSAWSNVRSVRNAIKSGFWPAWVELSIRPITEVDKIND